jgi:branched-chain amino acid aminotransferase
MGMRSRYLWMDGGLVEYEKATVHFLTPALHYGMGVFEGIRCYRTAEGPAIFRLREHAERLVSSARITGFRSLPYSAEEVAGAVRKTVAANGFEECYIRPLIYLAGGGWNLNIDGGRPAMGIAVWEWTNYLGTDALHHGVRANVSSFTRHHPNVMMTKAKIAGNYVNSFLAKTESVRLGFEEAIMLDPEGYVAECTGENLFIVTHGRILTPDLAPVLDGITRDAVITLARELNYDVEVAPLSRDQLYGADEVFVCGTASEVIGLREIDFRTIGTGSTGPVTRAIQEEFHAVIRGRHPRSRQWLELVARDEENRPGASSQVA